MADWWESSPVIQPEVASTRGSEWWADSPPIRSEGELLQILQPQIEQRSTRAQIDAKKRQFGSLVFQSTVRPGEMDASAGGIAKEAINEGARDILGVANSIGTGFTSPVSRLFSDKEADEQNRDADITDQALRELDDEKYASPIAWTKGIGRNVASTLPPAFAAAQLGGPYAAIGMASAQEGNRAITEAHDAGLKGADVFDYATQHAAAEAGPAVLAQALGAGGLESALSAPATKTIGSVAKSIGAELLEENATEFLHGSISLDPEQRSMAARLKTARDTTASTLLSMGIAESPSIANAMARRQHPTPPALAAAEAEVAEANESKSTAEQPNAPITQAKVRFGQPRQQSQDAPTSAPQPEEQAESVSPAAEEEVAVEAESGPFPSDLPRSETVEQSAPIEDADPEPETAATQEAFDPSTATDDGLRERLDELKTLDRAAKTDKERKQSWIDGRGQEMVAELGKRRRAGYRKPVDATPVAEPIAQAGLTEATPAATTIPAEPVPAVEIESPPVETPRVEKPKKRIGETRNDGAQGLRGNYSPALAKIVREEMADAEEGSDDDQETAALATIIQDDGFEEGGHGDPKQYAAGTADRKRLGRERLAFRELQDEARVALNAMLWTPQEGFDLQPGQPKKRIGEPRKEAEPQLGDTLSLNSPQQEVERNGTQSARARIGQNSPAPAEAVFSFVDPKDEPAKRIGGKVDGATVTFRLGESLESISPIPVAEVKGTPVPKNTQGAYEFGKSIRGTYRNADTGWELSFYRDGVKDTIARHGQDWQALAAVPQLARNAILFASEPYSGKMPGAKKVHFLYAPLRLDGRDHLARLLVVERDDAHYDVVEHRLYNVHTKERSPFTGTQAVGAEALVSNYSDGPRSSVSIGELIDAVKEMDPGHIADAPIDPTPPNPDDIRTIIKATPVRRLGRKQVSRQDVAAVFPGATIENIAGGWRAYVGQSYVDIQSVQTINVDWDALERTTGKKVPRELRDKLVAAGQYSVRTNDGRQHDGLGIIHLAADFADDSTLRHEALHLAKRAGLITPEEWAVLAKEYAPSETNEDAIEEAVAASREAVTKEATVWERVKSWLNRLVASLGFTPRQASDINQLMREAGFWQRQGVRSDSRTAYQLTTRPDLANPATDPGARNLVDEVDNERTAEGQPEVRPDSEVQAEASELLEADLKGQRAKLLAAGRAGEQLSDTQTVMAKSIINREAAEAVRSGDPKAIREAMALIAAYRQTGTEQARAFRQRRDPVESPAERGRRMIAEAILSPPKKQQEKINAARKAGDQETANKLEDDWASKFEDLKKKLLELGVDLDNLDHRGYSPVEDAQALSVISAAKADGWDMAYEFWRNSILSSPKTQTSNIIGNLGHAAWHLTAERILEAGQNALTGELNGATFSELKHLYAGALPGLSRASRNFLKTFITEMPQLDVQLGREGQFKHESPDVAIPGTIGRAVRLPQRLLLAADDFSKSLIAEMEAASNAHRIAKQEGLDGEALQRRIAELHADLASPAWDAAHESALSLTFNQSGGAFSQGLKKTLLSARRDIKVRGVPVLGYVLPFITTPINIFESAVSMTPAGSLSLASGMYQNYRNGDRVLKGQTARLARQTLAWAFVLALLGNDDDDPWITGAESSLTTKTRLLANRTRPAQSIKIGDRWVSYSRLEPFATAIALTVDWTMALKSGNTERMPKTVFASTIGQLKDKTFLSGLGDILTALEDDDKAGKWASDFAVSWVPNIARTAGRASEDSVDETHVWGKGADWWAMLAKRTAQKAEVVPVDEHPQFDLWGRPVRPTASPIAHTDWLYRMLVPSDTKLEDIFVGDRLLLNWNNQNPDGAKYPKGIDYTYNANGTERHFTDAQFAQFGKVTGKLAAKLVEADTWNVETPTSEDMKKLEEHVSAARSMAKELLASRYVSGDTPEDPRDAELDTLVSDHRIEEGVKAALLASQDRPKALTKKEREDGKSFKDKLQEWEQKTTEARKRLEELSLDRKDLDKAIRAKVWSQVSTAESRAERIRGVRRAIGGKVTIGGTVALK